jgi:dolichol-phosphate mannosyltransferase
MKVMVIVPTYNERDNIDSLLTQLLACDSQLHIVVVDDHSPDGTGDMVDQWASREHRVHAVHRSGKLGLGTAYIAGFNYALAHNAEHILTMDADFSHHPRFVPDMIRAARTADVVIGSRYVHGGGTLNCTFQRKLLSRGANLFAKILLGLQARDCTAGFRCYSSDVLDSIDFEAIRSNGYSYLIDMLYAVQNSGYRVAEIPILFEDRRFGTSKISSAEIGRAVETVLRLFRRRISGLFGNKRAEPTAMRKPTSVHTSSNIE